MDEPITTPRRAVMRGALAAGSSLWMPVLLSGCDQKPAEPKASSTAPAGNNAAPASPAKVAQSAVKYQLEAKDGQSCGQCLHFVAESGSCKLVEGQISPNGWCTLWVGKT